MDLAVAGYRHLPGPAGRGRALVDGAPWKAAAVPGDLGVSCQHPGPLPRSHQGNMMMTANKEAETAAR